MKKTIVILLLVFVTGLVFADYTETTAPDAATIRIYSSINGLLEHKITKSQVTNAGQFNRAEPVESMEVNLRRTTPQTIGYYSMRTNTRSIIGVQLTAEPLSTTGYYIPYTITVGETGKSWMPSKVAGTTALNNIVLTLVDSNPEPDPLEGINVYSQGMRLVSDLITVTFSENYMQTALEGEYTADITFSVTAI